MKPFSILGQPFVKNNTSYDISYSASANSKGARLAIKLIENITGRIALIKRASGYKKDISSSGKTFWEIILQIYKIDLEALSGDINNIPSEGPLILVCNHPFGILDGLLLGYLLSKRRNDFRIFAHHIFKGYDDLTNVILPINFDETREAVNQNIITRGIALDYLKNGGCIGIFPGGTVSTAIKPFGQPIDPSWRRFTAKLVTKSDARVLPVFFHGSNSRLFQIASHINQNLRLALLIREFKKHIDGKVSVSIGDLLPVNEIKNFCNTPHEMMQYLRDKTYSLSTTSNQNFEYGFDYDK